MKDYNIWCFKHEPIHLNEMVLNDKVKKDLNKALIEIPNLMLYGSAGVGKGTFTNILLNHTGFDYLWINASDETGIDVIREKVKKFATSLGATDLKIVVFNEAGSLSSGAQSAQKILKQMIEDTYKVTRFIFLLNEYHLMIDELKSRCWVIKIDNPPARDIFSHCENILKKENIKYDKKLLLNIIKKCYPDIRMTINTLQKNCQDKALISDEISTYEKIYKKIQDKMIENDVEEVRRTLKSNFIHYTELYKYLYENIGEFKSPGDMILLIGKALVDDNIVSIKEINFMKMFIEGIKQKAI